MRSPLPSVGVFVRVLVLAVAVSAIGPEAGDTRAAALVEVPALGLRVARGFRVTLYADANLADDIYAMTIDAHGNVVVTGRGYIRTLHDDDGDGVADRATDFAHPTTGGMGLCFAGDDLYFTGEGSVQRYTDANGDGVADGPAVKLLPLKFAEHGGHAIRKGPDGLFYVIAGNDTTFGAQHITHPDSPVKKIEGGALLRFSFDGRTSEAIAHGFRNPYDFDFNSFGDMFTWDSDCEREFLLPWHTPTRLFHIGYAGHHGWRLNGSNRSWARPNYYCDTVDILEDLGRGSPTGIACYRHFQFPPYWRNGLFLADWTFGTIYFAPIEDNGASYRGATEVFLEPMGTQGFAPNHLAVGPDGSLFISIGGRRTRGGVYRVQYADTASLVGATNWQQLAANELDAVLHAPQPLEAWSRAIWEPMALRVGEESFDDLVANPQATPEMRLRAVEVLTDLFGGLTTASAAAGARADSPYVRARVAWSLGRSPCDGDAPILLGLTRDAAPIVRRFAMEAIGDQASEHNAATLQAAIAANIAHPDKRLRQTAARLAALLPAPAWNALWAQQPRAALLPRLTATMAALWRANGDVIQTNAAESALAVLTLTRVADQRLDALRLLILALGDYHLQEPSAEVFAGYEPALPLAGHEALAARIRRAAAAVIPSGDVDVDFEAARLLAMLEADDAALPGKLLALIHSRSSATSDFHYLTVLSRLSSKTNTVQRVAAALLGLDKKLSSQQRRTQYNWTTRLNEVLAALLRREPGLADALIRHPDFATPGHLPLVPGLGAERFIVCARLYFIALSRDANFPWSAALIDLLSALPSEEVLPLFRRQWNNLALRDRLLLELARNPQLVDRDKFIVGLGSTQSEVTRACLGALLGLPRDESMKALLPAMRVLRAALGDTNGQTLRAQTVLLLNQQAGQNFRIQEAGGHPARAYQPVFDWFAGKYPALVPQLDREDAESQGKWDYIYKTVPWDKSQAARGEPIFASRCATCHAGPGSVAPDLGGIAQRLSPVDLLNAIVFPSRDIAPPYRQTTFTTRAGESHTGLIAFEAADSILVQTGAGTTVRLATGDIMSRVPSPLSLMPSGLLEGLRAQEIADLHGYLRTLPPSR